MLPVVVGICLCTGFIVKKWVRDVDNKYIPTIAVSYTHLVGVQVRMPFMKGYSVYVPFRDILKEWGVETITDVYGRAHPVDTIDCIWNISMFKGHKLFQSAYGDRAWDEYRNTVKKYRFKLDVYKRQVRYLRSDG